MNSEDIEKSYQFRALAEGKTKLAEMIRLAKQLEGSVENTGIHACGVIINTLMILPIMCLSKPINILGCWSLSLIIV